MSKGSLHQKRESAAQVKKEVDFMVKKGAPKEMVSHERRELRGVKQTKKVSK